MENKSIRMIISISLNVILVVAAIVLIFSVSSKAFSFGTKVFDEQSVDADTTAREVEVVIASNMSVKQLGTVLYNKGLIEDKNVFTVQVMLSDYKDKYIAGTYTLTTGMTPTEILTAISTVVDSGTNEE